ncbi:MAG: hypothetical protein QJR07_18060 [Acetobacteraceae bacterium]|nr:hypothetical protein [Acetobacteraceae bacterium]MDI3308990.1 hypothetical protein [Acetobacteraceae bacterium]
MGNLQTFRYHSGRSLLGGAASGLSYEGALRDAIAREEREWRRQAARAREAPPRPRPREVEQAKAPERDA